MNGKTLRLKRFLTTPNGRMVIFPLDHGVSCGPVPGLQRMDRVIRMGIRAGADALVMHKGMLRYLEPIAQRLPGIFMHLSASTHLGLSCHHKVLVGTVEEAVRRGADGVSVHVNLGKSQEPEMLKDLGIIGSSCAEWQMPLLVMIYVQEEGKPAGDTDAAIAHAARLAAELGADIIKISPPEDSKKLAEIAGSLPVPIVMAGGNKMPDTRLFLEKIEKGLEAGVRGVAVGRNVFQNEHPEILLKAICNIVHHGLPSSEAWDQFQQETSNGSTIR
jgi:predicted phospho-2-dehydro-3-deoxyheptonate aldolase